MKHQPTQGQVLKHKQGSSANPDAYSAYFYLTELRSSWLKNANWFAKNKYRYFLWYFHYETRIQKQSACNCNLQNYTRMGMQDGTCTQRFREGPGCWQGLEKQPELNPPMFTQTPWSWPAKPEFLTAGSLLNRVKCISMSAILNQKLWYSSGLSCNCKITFIPVFSRRERQYLKIWSAGSLVSFARPDAL